MNRLKTIGSKVLLLLSIFLFSGAMAQDKITITSIEKIDIVSETGSFYPVLNNKGDFICYSSYTNKGLYLYDFSTKKSIEISPITNLCTNVLFSDSDDTMYFSEKDILKKGDKILKSYNLNSGELSTIEEKKGENEKSWWEDFISIFTEDVDESTLNIEALKLGYFDYPYVQLEKGKIVLVEDGSNKALNPAGVQYYLNPVLSPDSKNISAQAVGKSAFVYNIDTKDYINIDTLEAVEWVSNSILIGMISEDDGHTVTKSTIVSYNLNSKEYTQILNDSIKGIYPKYSPKAGKIVCHTPDGEIYTITIELK